MKTLETKKECWKSSWHKIGNQAAKSGVEIWSHGAEALDKIVNRKLGIQSTESNRLWISQRFTNDPLLCDSPWL